MRRGPGARRASLLLAVGLLAVPACAQGAGSKSSFCDELDRLADPERIFDTFDRRNRFEDIDRAAAADDVDEVATELRDLERAAPRQIKADVAVLADFTSEVALRVREYGDDEVELRGRLYDLAQDRLGTATSAVKVSDYAESECGIKLRQSSQRDDDSDGPGSDEADPFAS